MNLERYPLTAKGHFELFEFESIGSKGRIAKVIQFIPLEVEGVYNLGFGDLTIDTGLVNDRVVSDNGDTRKVLATVVHSLYLFTERHPNAKIVVSGSTPSRNRLYRIALLKYMHLAEHSFHLFGDLGGANWEQFKPNTDYIRFLLIRKTGHDQD